MRMPIWKSKQNWAIDSPTPNPIPPTKGWKSKAQKGKEGKGAEKSVNHTCVEMNEFGPVIEETPGNEANIATRQINLA